MRVERPLLHDDGVGDFYRLQMEWSKAGEPKRKSFGIRMNLIKGER